jgi:hypothetical protein
MPVISNHAPPPKRAAPRVLRELPHRHGRPSLVIKPATLRTFHSGFERVTWLRAITAPFL